MYTVSNVPAVATAWAPSSHLAIEERAYSAFVVLVSFEHVRHDHGHGCGVCLWETTYGKYWISQNPSVETHRSSDTSRSVGFASNTLGAVDSRRANRPNIIHTPFLTRVLCLSRSSQRILGIPALTTASAPSGHLMIEKRAYITLSIMFVSRLLNARIISNIALERNHYRHRRRSVRCGNGFDSMTEVAVGW